MQTETTAVKPAGASAVHVAVQLRDLREWARHIVFSLAKDLPWEPGKTEALEAIVDGAALKRTREEAEALFLNLRELVRQADGVAYVEEATSIREKN